MYREKPLEQAILDRFFEQLAAHEDFSPEVLERLLRLRKEGYLRTSNNVLQTLREVVKRDV